MPNACAVRAITHYTNDHPPDRHSARECADRNPVPQSADRGRRSSVSPAAPVRRSAPDPQRLAAAQIPADAAAVIVEAATTDNPRFRWQTSSLATGFAGLSLADLDGSRVLGQTSGWVQQG